MKSHRTSFPIALCLTISAIAAPIVASAEREITTSLSPPPPRIERVRPREGFVWAPGYWEWRGHEHVWVAGRWMGERRGYHWVPDRWEQRGPHWHHEAGHWER